MIDDSVVSVVVLKEMKPLGIILIQLCQMQKKRVMCQNFRYLNTKTLVHIVIESLNGSWMRPIAF